MAIAALLLAAVYLVLIALLVAAGVGGVGVAVIAVAAFLAQYFTCERLALSCLGARPVSADQAPELHAAVTRLCVAATQPMPRLAVAPIAMPNAFTVGRTPSSATICVTTGLLELLDGPRLDAVLAHELAHVASRDVTVMTIASAFAALAAGAVQRATRPRRHRVRGGDDAGRRARPARGSGDRSPGGAVVIATGLVFLLSLVLTQALSWHRELAADRAAAAMTGDPDALAGALATVAARIEEMSQTELRGASGELAAFYIVAPDVTATVATVWTSHPPLADRLAALGELAGVAGGAGATRGAGDDPAPATP